MVGKTLSHYKILEELGRGGMGLVYKAFDTKLQREVAVKVLPRLSVQDVSAKKRFTKEAIAASRLEHQNICSIHSIDETPDGELFIVMPFYHGASLREHISRGILSAEEAVDICAQLLRGLVKAHDAGIIHRDIKPENVMLVDGRAILMDFGIAKLGSDDISTGMGRVVGSLAYMSPEQARGGKVDYRTDLWSLGIVMYELLVGRRPFTGDYDAAVLYAAANEEYKSVRSIRSQVPDSLELIVDQLLRKSPKDRFQSAEEVLSALTEGKEQRPIRTNEWAGKERKLVIGLAVLLIGAIIVYWQLGIPGANTAQRQVAASEQSSPDREAARRYVNSGMQKQQDRLFGAAELDYKKALELDPTHWGAWTNLAALYAVLGDYQDAIYYARRALDLNGEDPVALYNLGISLIDWGHPEEGIEAFSESVQMDSLFLGAYSAWGNSLIAVGRFEEAIDVLNRGIRISPDDPYLFLIHRNLGSAYDSLARSMDAIFHYENSVELESGQSGVVQRLATLYEQIGNHELAIEQWLHIIETSTDPVQVRSAQLNQRRLRASLDGK